MSNEKKNSGEIRIKLDRGTLGKVKFRDFLLEYVLQKQMVQSCPI